MSEYVTLKAMAKSIGLNYSTSRNYVNDFQAYFHPVPLEGSRWPKYEAGDVEVLRLIRDVKRRGGDTYEVSVALQERYGDIQLAPENNLSVSRPITSSLAQTAELLRSGQKAIDYAVNLIHFYETLLEGQKHQIEQQGATIEQLQDAIELLRAEVERLRRGGGG